MVSRNVAFYFRTAGIIRGANSAAEGSRVRRLSLEFAWVVLGQALAAAGCIVGVRLLTGVMSPSSYGELMLAITAVTLAQHVLVSPLALAAQRFFASAGEAGDLGGFFAGVWQLGRSAGLAIGVTALIVAVPVAAFAEVGQAWTVLTAGLLALVLAVAAILDAIHNAARIRTAVAWHQAGSQWLRWAGAALAVSLLGPQTHVALLGSTLGLMLMCIPRYRIFARHVGFESKSADRSSAPVWRHRLVSYLWPFASWGVLGWAMSASDRWALQCFASTEAVGRYAVLFQLGFFPCVMLADTLQQFLAPILFQRAGGGDNRLRQLHVLRLNRWLVLCGGALFAGLLPIGWLAGEMLLTVFAGPAFRGHADLFPWMMVAGCSFAMGQLAALGIVSSVHSHRLLPVKIGSSLLCMAAHFLGAWWYGLPGVVGGMLIGCGVYLGWSLLAASRLEQELRRAADAEPHGVEALQEFSPTRKNHSAEPLAL